MLYLLYFYIFYKVSSDAVDVASSRRYKKFAHHLESPSLFFWSSYTPTKIKQNKNPYVMRCAIWYHLYNLKNLKNTHGGVLILVKLPATLLKSTLLHGCFSRFLNCTNGTKSRSASHIPNVPKPQNLDLATGLF